MTAKTFFFGSESDTLWHEYVGSLRGCKAAASKSHDSNESIEICDTAVFADTGTKIANNVVSVKVNGKWTDS